MKAIFKYDLLGCHVPSLLPVASVQAMFFDETQKKNKTKRVECGKIVDKPLPQPAKIFSFFFCRCSHKLTINKI